MFKLDLQRWAIVGVKDETGTGRMGQDLKRALNPIRYLVAPSYRLAGKLPEGDDTPLACADGDDAVREQLDGLQGVILFEDPPWALQAIRLAHQLKIKVVFVVLWEWLRFYVPEFQHCDLFVCVHDHAAKITRRLGFDKVARLTWPLNIAALPRREITGPARRFSHNVGLLEKDDRKGTAITLEAFKKVPRKDIELVVRIQNSCDLPVDDPRVRIESRHLEHHGDLYRLGDVAVQPSKCEGLGFMLLEALAAGLPVVTTDYPPMNEYVRDRRMLVSTKWGKFPAEQTPHVHQAHFKIPRTADLAKKIAWCADHDLSSISAANRQWAAQMFDEHTVREQWLASMERTLA